MKKYLAYYETEWPSNIAELTAVENKPFVGYLKGEGVIFTVIPEEGQSEYQIVDLGLSVKWADRNVGAATPQDSGLYFDWGNVDGHAVDENGNITDGYSFDSTTYSTTLGGQYTGSTLDAEHDAATVNMGGGWRMPTQIEWQELYDNTTRTWIDISDNEYTDSEVSWNVISSGQLKGLKLTSAKEGYTANSIFLPASGRCGDSLYSDAGIYGYFWSSSLDSGIPSDAYTMFFGYHGSVYPNSSGSRCGGHPVRGVRA